MTNRRREEKTVAELTPVEQIERLVSQRNALWRLIDEFVGDHAPNGDGTHKEWMRDDDDPLGGLAEAEIDEDGTITVTLPDIGKRLRETRLAAERLYAQAEEIVGNPYIVEGYNPRTGERLSDIGEDMPNGFEPYLNAAGDSW